MEFLNHYRLRITATLAILVVVILYFLVPSSKPSISGFVKPTQADIVVTKTDKSASDDIVIKNLNTFFDSKTNAAGIVLVNYHDTTSCSLNLGKDTSKQCSDYLSNLHIELDNKAKLMASELHNKRGEGVVKTLKRICSPPLKGKIDFASWRCIYWAYS